MVEACVALPRAIGRGWINGVEVSNDFLHRSMQAVQIQAVEAGLAARALSPVGVVGIQPVNEIPYHDVAPRPSGEALEPAQCLRRGSVSAEAAHVPVDAIGVGPVRLRRDGTEALLVNQPLRDFGPRFVEFLCAVRTLA